MEGEVRQITIILMFYSFSWILFQNLGNLCIYWYMWEKKSHISDFICLQCTCTYPVQCTCNNRISDLKFIRSQIYTLSGGKKQRSIIKRKQASCYCIFKQNFYNGQFIWSAAPQSTFEGKDRRTSYTHTHVRTQGPQVKPPTLTSTCWISQMSTSSTGTWYSVFYLYTLQSI